MSDKFVDINDSTGELRKRIPITTSSGSGDSFKIAATSTDGQFDPSLVKQNNFAQITDLDSPYYVTLNGVDVLIEADATNAAIVIYLDIATLSNKGLKVSIKKIDGSMNAVSVLPRNLQLLDRLYPSYILSLPRSEFSFMSTGSGYNIL